MTKIKKISTKQILWIASGAAIVAVAVFFLLQFFNVSFFRRAPVLAPPHTSSVVDVENPRELAGLVDYVFLGRVEQRHEEQYDNVVTRLTETGPKKTGDPYILYDVTVIENAKGDLSVGNTRSIKRYGGLTMDKKYLIVEEGETLPEEGDVCMFFVSAQEDGTLLVAGPNCSEQIIDVQDENRLGTAFAAGSLGANATKELTPLILATAKKSSLYQELLAACADPVPYERARYQAAP